MSEHSKNLQRLENLRRSNQQWARRTAKSWRNCEAKSCWKRKTFVLPRLEARERARAFLLKYPKAAYWTEVESWRVLDGDMIEFTMRRLPTAD